MTEEIIDRGDGDIDANGKADDTADLTPEELAAAEKELALENETPEAKAEREKVEKAEKEKNITIPKARMDEAVGKARKEAQAAIDRADALEAQLKASTGMADVAKLEEQIDTAEDKLEKAIADGNVELKQALRKEIRALNRQISDSGAAAHAARATATAVEQVRYEATVTQLELDHPELNPDNEDTYDAEKVAELSELKAGFEALGHSSSDALRKALKAVYRDGPKPAAADDDGKTDEEKQAEAEAKAKRVAEKAAEIKAAAVAKALAAKGKQPVDQKKTGLESDKGGQKSKDKPVSKMSDKEYDALPEEEKARARGDIL